LSPGHHRLALLGPRYAVYTSPCTAVGWCTQGYTGWYIPRVVGRRHTREVYQAIYPPWEAYQGSVPGYIPTMGGMYTREVYQAIYPPWEATLGVLTTVLPTMGGYPGCINHYPHHGRHPGGYIYHCSHHGRLPWWVYTLLFSPWEATLVGIHHCYTPRVYLRGCTSLVLYLRPWENQA